MTSLVYRFGLIWTCFDDSPQVIAILDRIKAGKKKEEDEDDGQFGSSNGSQDDRDWEGDDPDEGIIYVD